jgi:hypothetical protein
MGSSDELTSIALGFKRDGHGAKNYPTAFQHPDIAIRYSKEELLSIYKSLGKFEHPNISPEIFSIKPEAMQLFSQLSNPKPDVIPEILREDLEQKRIQS